ncbi:MAG: threonine aldolase [Flavisolibacter sp.]|jgi:D-serine deaminase-like pyridoxal phosphate-dependent protein|nr:threonine aldolase [Flavisolibacter sp.]
MNAKAAWYHVSNIDEIDTPALLFYPERIEENISGVKKILNNIDRLRPHVKTHKCIEVAQLMLSAGITKFKCATIAEAEMLAIAKAPDVLFAYQPVLIKLHRLLGLIKTYKHTKFSCLIDNISSATMIAAEAEKSSAAITVFIDVNTGMNRTGIIPALVFKLYEACLKLNGITVQGLHVYDGHIYTSNLQQRSMECEASFAEVETVINQIEAKGNKKLDVVAGGTPTFPVFAKMTNVECSPGTFILWDAGYQKLFPDLPFVPAALIITRVISILNDDTFCLDIGHKSISAENDLANRVVFLNAPDVKFIAHSEEHLVIKTSNKNAFKIGDVLYGLPVHICPTCALYEEATIINNEKADCTWKIIARNRIIAL